MKRAEIYILFFSTFLYPYKNLIEQNMLQKPIIAGYPEKLHKIFYFRFDNKTQR